MYISCSISIKNTSISICCKIIFDHKRLNEALLPDLSPEQQPIVTVMESKDENLPVGARMTLSEAETQIGALNQRYWDSDEPERPVRVAIDYMLDGEVDRYWLPLRTGPGCGSLLEQMPSACLGGSHAADEPGAGTTLDKTAIYQNRG